LSSFLNDFKKKNTECARDPGLYEVKYEDHDPWHTRYKTPVDPAYYDYSKIDQSDKNRRMITINGDFDIVTFSDHITELDDS
jgi:hypothetical protein